MFQTSLLHRGRLGFWIDLDPVVSHPRVHHIVCGLRNNYVRLLERHMAVDAVVLDRMAKLCRELAASPGMTAEALRRVRFGRLLSRVYIVASRAGHTLRRDVALAPLQQANLITVNVRVLRTGSRKLLVITAQRLARNIRECRGQWRSLDTVMTFSA